MTNNPESHHVVKVVLDYDVGGRIVTFYATRGDSAITSPSSVGMQFPTQKSPHRGNCCRSGEEEGGKRECKRRKVAAPRGMSKCFDTQQEVTQS